MTGRYASARALGATGITYPCAESKQKGQYAASATMKDALPVHTRIAIVLASAGNEGRDTLDQLMPLVYDQLREMAHRQLAREYGGRPLQTTALVHEAYLRVVDKEGCARSSQSQQNISSCILVQFTR